MSRFRIEDFSTSSHDVVALKSAKETLRKRDFPVAEARAVVRQFFDPEKFSHLRDGTSRPIVYLVAPSTSDTNFLPELFAMELQSRYPGVIVQGWATPVSATRTALKGGIRKLREPSCFAAVPGALDGIDPSARLVLVDDVVTTGTSVRGLREVLFAQGKRAEAVVSLTQSELRKVSDRDIDRITAKLGDPAMRPAVAGVLGNQLKHAANYIERVLNESTRLEISSHFKAEFDRLRQLGLAHEGPARGTPLSLGGFESTQRRARAGADVPSGVSREGVRLRSGIERAQSGPSGAPGIVPRLTALRERWPAADLHGRADLLKQGLGLVDDLGGAPLTRLPLRATARDYIQGEATLKALTERTNAHAAAHGRTRTPLRAKVRGFER
jgi:hypothetical protein